MSCLELLKSEANYIQNMFDNTAFTDVQVANNLDRDPERPEVVFKVRMIPRVQDRGTDAERGGRPTSSYLGTVVS